MKSKKNIRLLIYLLLTLILGIVITVSCKKFELLRLLKIETGTVENVSDVSVTVSGEILDINKEGISQYGHCISLSENPTVDLSASSELGNSNRTGSYTSTINHLSPDTKYFVRAYAISSEDVSYGKVLNFTTLSSAKNIALVTNTVTNITSSSASCGGSITITGEVTIISKGVCWSNSENPTLSDEKTNNGTGSDNFTSTLSGLTADTTYFVRAYATTTTDTLYGNQRSFKTNTVNPDNNPPVITSTPDRDADEDTYYSYILTATDSDSGDKLTFGSITIPGWISFNATTGELNGTPSNDDVGSHFIKLSVSDSYDMVYDTFTIIVNNVNDAPNITSVDITEAATDEYYSYTLTAEDIDIGDNLSFASQSKPDWLDFNSSNQELSGTPTIYEKGDHTVVIRISDGTTYIDHEFTITVILPTGTFTDSRDGQAYGWVKLGIQTWMTENLNYGEQINGSVPASDNPIVEKYCYEDNEANCDIYGGLYTWYEMMGYTEDEPARGICPAGWHIPSDNEWKTLEKYLGMSNDAADSSDWRGTDEGGKLKETGYSHWFDPNEGATNITEFNALPAGYSIHDGTFDGIQEFTTFWTSTEPADSAVWYRLLHYQLSNIQRVTGYPLNGTPLRCVQD